MTLRTTPRATARLQFHKDFTLDDAVALVPYYAALGVSHLYASPLLTARAGSMHGYDVIDPTRINPELGGMAALERLGAALRAHEMGLLLDIVPNHMAVGGADNPWWQDVLEHGQRSAYADFFDIDWDNPDPLLNKRVLAPYLGMQYGEALQSGEIKLTLAPSGGLVLRYQEHELPLSLASTAPLLRGLSAPAAQLFAVAAQAADPARAGAPAKAALLDFAAARPEALAAHLARFSTPARLHQLLRRQHYRLAWWRTAAAEINWRRFFDINSLVGLRVERPEVFNATHGLILELYARGLIDGVRVDHVDGLAVPGAYLRKLRRAMAAAGGCRPEAAAHGAPYIVVEKILAAGETMPARWQADGTTGYDFMDQVSAVLHDPSGEAELTALWSLTGRGTDFLQMEDQTRRQILRDSLAGELTRLAGLLTRLARQQRNTTDFSYYVIKQGLQELLAAFPVYRLYAGPAGADAEDGRAFDTAMALAAQRIRRADRPVLDLLRHWLLEARPCALPAGPARALLLRTRIAFQQLSSPTAAKAVEDTAFYRFGRLLSRNEVGSNPGQFSLTPASFHAQAAWRGAFTPGAMLATATHDHKRGEDTRARLAVLSEIPGEWELAATRWMRLNAAIREPVGPDAADELMLYQMLVAGWPLGLEAQHQAGIEAYGARLAAWQQKSLREAKLHSEWAAPNEEYEAACARFLMACLDARRPMLYELIAFANRIAAAGAINGLTQTLLRLSVPGVPDLYQGTEFWDQSFVDPDNRRKVDFTARIAGLRQRPEDLITWRDGRVKQSVIARALAARREMHGLFAHGSYEALEAEGDMAAHLIAFRRADLQHEMLAFGPRLAGGFMVQVPLLPPNVWGTTHLAVPSGRWRDELTGTEYESRGTLLLREVLAKLPVALLRRV